MKISLKLTAFIVIAIMLLGCSSTYTIKTKDGRKFQASDKPDTTADRYVKFLTTSGKEVLLKQDEVLVISED